MSERPVETYADFPDPWEESWAESRNGAWHFRIGSLRVNSGDLERPPRRKR